MFVCSLLLLSGSVSLLPDSFLCGVQHEQQRVVELERLNTFKLMLEKEAQFVETKRGDLARGYNPAVAIELASAEKRVRELQQKYNQMANRLGLPTSESQPLLVLYSFWTFLATIVIVKENLVCFKTNIVI